MHFLWKPKKTTRGGAESNSYALTEPQARARFQEWRHVDPFPDIDCALLNSADIADYVAATGLIYPFDESKLKPASYPLALGGKILWWDNRSRERRVAQLDPGDDFELQPNSIAFVTLAPLLQVPDYIALRFNLRIRNVYRGLLLGTGPLVDPGFTGQLSFPLHNLTTNPYHFRGGEDVIWVEFTKLSRASVFNGDVSSAPTRKGAYEQYREREGREDVEDYVREALGGATSGHVWSSISEALAQADKAVRRSTWINVAGGIAILAVGIAVLATAATIWWSQWDLPRKGDVEKNADVTAELRREVEGLRTRIRILEARQRPQPRRP